MKPILITLLFITSSFIVAAQEKTPQEKFEKDVKRKQITLYILGGFAARTFPGDKDFQIKYKVTYYDFGCLAPANLDFYMDYNLLVLKHLTDKFDRKWHKDLRKDILGWDEWDKKH